MPPDPETHPHAHTIAECKAKYESSFDYSYSYLSKWSGWSRGWLCAVGKKEKWAKGRNSTDVNRDAAQKIESDESTAIADFNKSQLGQVHRIDNILKGVLNTLTRKLQPVRKVN